MPRDLLVEVAGEMISLLANGVCMRTSGSLACVLKNRLHLPVPFK